MNSYRGGAALAVQTYDNAVLMPRTRKRKRMRELGLFVNDVQIPWSTSAVVVNPQDTLPPVVFHANERVEAVIDEEVIFIGTLWCMWGHLITDFSAHIWPVLTLPKSLRVAYMVGSATQTLPTNFKGLLAALGVSADRLVEVRKPTRFRRVHFGEPSLWHESGTDAIRWTDEYARTIDAAIAGVLGLSRPTPHRKVYFTRTGLVKNGKDFGERAIENAYRRVGFEVVSPEKLSFAETVRLLAETETLAATEGSVSHNALFLPKGARLEILRKCETANTYQEAINKWRELNVEVFNVSFGNQLAVPQEACRGPFLLGVTPELAAHLGCAVVPPSRGERFKCFLCRAKMWLKEHRI